MKTILKNGKFYIEKDSFKEAILIEDGIIKKIGSNEEILKENSDEVFDLKGKTVVVSVEPSPDNSPKPFSLKPLAKMIPTDASVHSTIMMGQGPAVEISGVVKR